MVNLNEITQQKDVVHFVYRFHLKKKVEYKKEQARLIDQAPWVST